MLTKPAPVEWLIISVWLTLSSCASFIHPSRFLASIIKSSQSGSGLWLTLCVCVCVPVRNRLNLSIFPHTEAGNPASMTSHWSAPLLFPLIFFATMDSAVKHFLQSLSNHNNQKQVEICARQCHAVYMWVCLYMQILDKVNKSSSARSVQVVWKASDGWTKAALAQTFLTDIGLFYV